MTAKTHQEPLPVLITLVLLLAAAGNVFVYVPAAVMRLDAPVLRWAFFLAIALLLGKGRSRHYIENIEKRRYNRNN